MIDALITGKLAADPEARTASNGNRYCAALVWVTTGAEDRLSVLVIAFDPDTVAGLLAMAKDETVALAGELTSKVWTDRDGNAKPSVDMKAHALPTPYHVTRKRQAMAGHDAGNRLPLEGEE